MFLSISSTIFWESQQHVSMLLKHSNTDPHSIKQVIIEIRLIFLKYKMLYAKKISSFIVLTNIKRCFRVL
jgi:hypothetical protein